MADNVAENAGDAVDAHFAESEEIAPSFPGQSPEQVADAPPPNRTKNEIEELMVAASEQLSDTTSNETLILKEPNTSIASFDQHLHEAAKASAEPFDHNFSLRDIPSNSDNLTPNQPMKTKLSVRLHSMLHDSSKSATLVVVGRFKFHCHLIVLRVYSTYFEDCKNTVLIKLPPEHVTPPAFHAIYNWMLDKHEPKSCDNFVELFTAAIFLKISDLTNHFWNMVNETVVTENVAFALYCESAKYEMAGDFGLVMLSRVCKFFLTFVASREFVELDVKVLCDLLQAHNLGVNSEIEVFMAALRWLSHDWPKRQTEMIRVLRCVRFGLLPPPFLRYLQNPQNTLIMHHIQSSPAVKEMINKAFIYASTELFVYDYSHRNEFMLPDCKVPIERRWIYDQHCPYHHYGVSPHRQFFTYEQFLNYLRALQETSPAYWQNLPLLQDLHGPVEF